jgi:Tol biopolymer transport system component/DNA-binding winged helix-turn-helix (wHTH) protein
MSLKNKDLYEFGDFRLNTAEKLLINEKGQNSLPPKVFDLLTLFLENSGKLLTKEEILEKVWAESFVEESNLAFTIAQIRKLLNDNARQPKYIETVPKRGYRFIAQIKEPSVPKLPAETAVIKQSETATTNIFSTKTFAFLSVAILLLATVAIAAYWINIKSVESPLLNRAYNLAKLTESGKSQNSAISPDGKFVVYPHEVNSSQSLWRKQLESGESLQILPPVEAIYGEIQISKDGQNIFFARRLENAGFDIFRLPVLGGVPAKITGGAQGVFGVSPDEKMISFVRCPNLKEEECALFTANIDGGNEKKIFVTLPPANITGNEFSFFENAVVFAHGQSHNASKEFSLSKINLETGVITDIAQNSFFGIRHLECLPTERKYIVSGRTDSSDYARIWLVDETGSIEQLTNDSSSYLSLSVDEKSDKLVATEVGGNFNLHVASFDKPNISSILTQSSEGAGYLPNGKILYSVPIGGAQNIWEINRDGSGQRQLTTNGKKNVAPFASRDGKFIFYSSNETGSFQIWRMNSDGANKLQLTKNEGGYPIGISADEANLYYFSPLNSKIMQTPIHGGEENPAFDRSAGSFAVSPDGMRLARFAGNPPNRKLQILKLADRKLEKEYPVADQTSDLVWSPTNEFIVYVSEANKTSTLWRQYLKGGEPEKITDLGTEIIMQIAVSPDGKDFLVNKGGWKYDSVLLTGLK